METFQKSQKCNSLEERGREQKHDANSVVDAPWRRRENKHQTDHYDHKSTENMFALASRENE